MTSRSLRIVFNIAIIISMLLPNVTVASAQARAPEPAPSPQARPGPASDSGLYRTRITVDSPARWARLEKLEVAIMERYDDSALVLVDAEQLETLARLRFQPRSSDELSALVVAQGESKAWLAAGLQPLLRQGAALRTQVEAKEKGEAVDSAALDAAQADLRAALHALTPEQTAGIASSISPDDDGDGLTNTQEAWWCTDPLNADTDSDGLSDGAEIQMLKDWMGNRRAGPPGGTPWPSWPFNDTTCPDKDRDSIPNLAERWELGLNMDWESTDHDKFDDGQELFGVTYCPGGDLSCGYGDLPRSSDSGYVGATMPSWVKSPGNHPLVAAFPVPEVDVVESSFHVQTVTTVTTDHTIGSGTERSYSTAKTEGTSTSVANTVTWNEWQEVSESLQQRQISALHVSSPQFLNSIGCWFGGWGSQTRKRKCIEAKKYRQAKLIAEKGCKFKNGGTWNFEGGLGFKGVANVGVGYTTGETQYSSVMTDSRCKAALRKAHQVGSGQFNEEYPLPEDKINALNIHQSVNYRYDSINIDNRETNVVLNNSFDSGSIASGLEGLQYSYTQAGELIADRLYEISAILAAPVRTETNTRGRSWGGSQTTTNTEYEEHTVTNGEAFSNSESWGNATAVDSAHTADLWFTYKVRNMGTEYAREIGDLVFNIYIGDDPNPATTYFVANDVGDDGKFHNFMPNEEHTYTSARIPLTLEQMKAIDLGGPLRIVVEDFTYGADELFYQDAANASVLIAIEDGTDDGNELIDTYLIPTWGSETVLDVLARYFPHELDENGMMVAIWTPEYRADTPAWCDQLNRVGTTLWCRHALSTADWWNIYTNGMGDGSQGFQDTPASPGSVALFRFNKDSDLDGYSDRSESKLGTDPNDPADFPRPELIAGMHSIRSGDHVTATLSLLNTGLYDAYGVEAVMIAPDDSISITNNTVGGSGRVRAQKQVIVGSRILLQSPLPAAWTQANHAQPAAGGYYAGQQDRTYTFTVACGNPGGCDVGSGTWSLNWDDGAGASGALNFGAGYDSPTLLDVGAFGLKLGLRNGRVNDGESFKVDVRTPRDTFQYDINREPYTAPLVIVSYNDPQGNHRFLLPGDAMSLSHPTDNLVPLGGKMLPDVGVDIVTSQAAQAGANSTDLLISNPSEVTLTNAHLFLEFVNITGTVVSEVPMTTTIQPGPNVVTIDWNTADFNPAYQPDEDYIVMAFWTDYQGNILDTAARPLSSFQDDPRPAFAMTQSNVWDFGTAQQGTILRRSFVFANTGFTEMRTHLDGGQGITVETPPSNNLAPGDTATYTVTLNTEGLATGPYQETLTIRTNDPEHPTETITIQGEITERPCDGFLGEYFDNQDLSGTPTVTRCDGVLDFNWGSGSPDPSLPSDHISARWTREFVVYNAGNYTFETRSDDGVRVYVDDQLVIDEWENQGFLFASGTMNLSAGVHLLRVEWYENAGSAAIRLVYGPENMHLYPLDWDAYISGSHNQGEWVNFTHTLGPDPQTLHPVKVYSADYGTFWGVGKYATDFGQGTAPGDMFGDGRDGTMPSSGNLDNNNGFGIGSVSGNAGSTSVSVTDRHAVWRIKPGDVVLLHQTQGSGAGNWELNKAVSDFSGSGTFTLEEPLEHTYSSSGSNRAQIIRVPQYSSCNVTGTVTPLKAWDGTFGGIFVVMCNGTISVSGTIDANEKGFRHGHGVNESERYSWQGEGYPGAATKSMNANGNGGGGGLEALEGGNGGGGGGNGSAGASGEGQSAHWGPGQGGGTAGSSDLRNMVFGGGGGGGGRASGNAGADGGDGGGIIVIRAKDINVSGSISARGGRLQGSCTGGGAGEEGGGGGGAGGSIFLTAENISVGNGVRATGGACGAPSSGSGKRGGAGGTGRIRIEYCNSISGNTNPSASTAKIDCYIIEQIESSPYDSARLNLPESFSNGRYYQVQYGRRFVFSGVGEQSNTLRLPASMLDSATLDALISDAGSGTLTFKLDIGDDGSWDWQVSQSVSDHASWTSPDLSAAFNRYWSANGAALSGDMDVPVRVSVSKGAQVLLTNFRIQPAGDKTRHVRLAARTYDTVNLTLTVSDGSGPLSVAADVGNDGSVDWTWNGDPAYPVQLTTENLASAFNVYLSGQSGEVDVPVRFYLTPMNPLSLSGLTATPAGQIDVHPAAPQASASSPTEGDEIALSARLQNNGDRDSGPLTASFFATPPGGSEWYIGSAFVPNVPAGGTAQASIPWNTLGFTGDAPVRVVVDPFNRLTETNEDNNEATATLSILTRPDLAISRIQLSDDEPLAGESITITLPISNTGQTKAGSAVVALTAQTPDGSVVTLCEPSVAVGARGQASATCAWTPIAPGRYRLLAHADKNDAVDESDEGNNDLWRDVYVGLASPVLLDSGGANDPAYDASTGYGYLNGQASTFCGSEPDKSQRSDYSGHVDYRFDHLLPGHYYHLDLTFYECDGLGRQQQITVDGNLISPVISLSDGEVHRLSYLLDPAFYADRSIIIQVQEILGNDAAVAGIRLYDIDYRYADAGSDEIRDPAYHPATNNKAYGWLDGKDQAIWGSLPYQTRRIDLGDNDPADDPDNELRYRFDGLDANKHYQLHMTFYQKTGGPVEQSIFVDGVDTEATIALNGEQRADITVNVPPQAYLSDGVIVLQVVRTNALVGAFVNEVALEEETLSTSTSCTVPLTPDFTEAYGNLSVNGAPAPIGTLVEALNPRGDVVGCFVTTAAGEYGLMRIYGEDASVTPPIPGMRSGETVTFRINGRPATATPPLIWQNDRLGHTVDLAAGSQGQAIPLRDGWTLASFRLQPPNTAVTEVMHTVDGFYDRILGEVGTYDTSIPSQFNTLHEMLPARSYWIHTTSAATLNITGTAVAADTPIDLHAGWNWVGYLPQASHPVTQALASIDGLYTRVIGDDGTYDVTIPPSFNTLKEMRPGAGYLIYMTQAGTLTYPAAAAQAQAPETSASSDADLCPDMARTPWFSEIYGQAGAAYAEQVLRAYDPRGQLVGCAQVREDGSYGLMRLYGGKEADDALTPGLLPGEGVQLAVDGETLPAVTYAWSPDHDVQPLDIPTPGDGYHLWMPMIGR